MAPASKTHIAYAAFLRGIGPGDPNRSNESLKKVFSSLGFQNVRSFISSGNILFESAEKNAEKLEREIEAAFTKQLGIDVKTFIRSKAELDAFVASSPFGKLVHSSKTYLTVTLLKKSSPVVGKTLDALKYDKKIHALYSVIDNTVGKTPDFMVKLEKGLGKEITTRTFNTVERVARRL